MEFTIDCVPPRTSHHSKKIVRIGKFSRLADTDALKSARETWMELLRPHAPAQPVKAPVALVLELTWPWRSSDSRKLRAEGRIPCVVKPDLDNVAKTVTDVLTVLRFIEGDQGVVFLQARKWIGDRPGLRVVITRDYLEIPVAAAR